MPNRNVFTTGEAARICGISQQTIIRCFDLGKLKGYRVPGSRFRRIPKKELRRFMEENQIASTALKLNILVLTGSESAASMKASFSARLNGHAGDVVCVTDTLSFGERNFDLHPSVIVLDCREQVVVPAMLAALKAQQAKRLEMNLPLAIAAIVRDVSEASSELKAAADRLYTEPFDVDTIAGDMIPMVE